MENETRKKKIVVFFVIAAFLTVLSYFTMYESANMIHECSDEHCAICHELHLAEAFVNQLTFGIVVAVGCILYMIFIEKMEIIFRSSISERNLVVDKVRMDN